MAMPVNAQVLQAGLSRLGKLTGSDVRLEPLLEETVDAVHGLFGLSGAGFLVLDEQNALRSVVASDAAGEALEATQQETGQGPCVDALVRDVTAVCADMGRDARYADVGPRLVERGVGAVLGVPIRVGGGPIGALNVYVNQPHAWADDEIAALETYGSLLGQLLTAALLAAQHGRLADQLQYALDNRVVIDRAVGFLMGRHREDDVAAFNRLRRAARDRQRRVSDLAEDVLAERIRL